jgi:starch-binding outer membrane protein, SusD/RagB family
MHTTRDGLRSLAPMRRGRTMILLRALGVAAVVLTLSACDNLLDVSNPSAITEENLKGDDQTVEFMANGVMGEFRREFAWLAAHSAVFTDEAIQGHPWSPWNVYDSRTITPDSPAYDGLSYQLLQRARGSADALIPKMEAALGARAGNSLQLARAAAYGGYSYIMLADFLCEAPLQVSAPVASDSLYKIAIAYFQKAEQIATTLGTAAGAPEVLNIARVGLARAYLNIDDKPKAIQAAAAVPANFSAWIRYATDAADWQVYNFMNWFAGYRFAGELDLALDPGQVAGITDPRMPYDATLRRLGNGVRDGYLPYQTSSYSEWVAGQRVMFGETTAMRFASGLEARYIIAEAGGMSATETRAFVNERRLVGQQGVFGGTDAQLFTELLDQRYRDFFLDGHRIGDLRRYKKFHQLDLWPHGTMPGLTQQYGSQECWPIAASEMNSNPNIPR